MSNHKFLITSILAFVTLSSFKVTESAQAKETITYQSKVKKTTMYNSLPTSKKVKGKSNYKLSGSFSSASIASVHGVKYALLTKNGNKVGWFKLSTLNKITTKTTTVKKKTNPSTNTTKTSTAVQNTNSNPSTDTNQTTNTDPNASTAIPNMDYSNAASNNPSSTVLSLMNQSGVNWDDPNTLSAISQSALNQLNSIRNASGIASLTINDQLTKIAQMRAQQIASNFNHRDANNNLIAYDDAQQLGLDINKHSTFLAENLGKSFYVGGDTPASVSNKIITAFQAEGPENGDGNEHGHYVNDMDSNNKQVGISFYHAAGTNDLYMAMEFGNYYN